MKNEKLTKKHRNSEIIDGYLYTKYKDKKEIEVLEHNIEETEDEFYFNACLKIKKGNKETEKILENMIKKQESPLTTELKKHEREVKKEAEEGKRINLFFDISEKN